MAAITQTRPAAPAIRTPLFVVGVGLALLAFLLMFAFGALFVGRTQTVTQVKVVVATQDIGQRQGLDLTMLGYGTVASTSLPPHAITRINELAGYTAVVAIYKGEVITSNVVSSNPDLLAGPSSAYLPIPKGFVALTLPTNEQQGVAGFIAQGDYVNVMVTLNTTVITPVNPRSVTRTVFTNLHVIRVGPDSNLARQSGVAQGLSSSITVVMSQCDAQYMYWFLKNADMKYDLLAYPDYAAEASGGGASCPSVTAPPAIGPAAVDARWGFTKA